MTTKNRKVAAVKVDVFPAGRVLKTEGDYALIEIAPNTASWHVLNPVPAEVSEVVTLPKGVGIVRKMNDVFLLADGTWVKVVAPTDTSKLKTYFQVMKVQHTQLIINPQVVLVQYRRDKTTEWVRNIQVAEKKVHAKALA